MSEAIMTSQILLVDDDPALLDALAEALELRLPEVNTQSCNNARTALAQVERGNFDAVISDIKMPGMDGIELLSRVREMRPDTPVILITGHGQTDLAIQALRAGAFDLIQKPLDRDYFMAALRRALEVKRLRVELAEKQQALQQYTENLESRVSERTSELEQALRAKDEFLGLVSHELRNPMTVIMGNADALYRYGDALTADAKDTALSDLRTGTKRLMQLIENLLVLAKAEYGIRESEPVLLTRLVQAEVAWLHQFSSERDVIVDLPPELDTPILCNPTHVSLILKNLIGNADKYSPRSAPVEVLVRQNGDEVIVSVRDSGPGIALAERELIFQPFYRSRSTADVNGMGIGLAVCEKLVTLNGGRIWLDESPQGGCDFSFSLRLTREAETEAVAEPTLREAGVGGGVHASV